MIIIKNSYIEIFKSTYAEAHISVMNDTQSLTQQRDSGSNQNYGNQQQGNLGGHNGNMSRSGGDDVVGYSDNMNQHGDASLDNYNS
ncbi:unnamed protein product [Rotaria sp. Silwood1]|nr:unnamed protein product [Rotaria sp. Silwood1]